jgi:hypothetical protein
MRASRWLTGLLAGLTVSAGVLAQGMDTADGMRCGSDLISVGDTEFDVVNSCGEPAFKDGNRWAYEQGEGTLVKYVIFMGGQVASIRVGSRDD